MCDEYSMYFNITGGDFDFFPKSYTVTFPIGFTIVSSNITILAGHILIDDRIFVEENETFDISITSITNGHIVGTPAVATVTIIDTSSKYIHTYVNM